MKRYLTLDSWRGICAMMVVLHHFPGAATIVTAAPLVRNGNLFVDFFFVLSGFVISHAWRGEEPGSFILRRLWRLWPLHIVMLFAFIAWEVLRINVTGQDFHQQRTLEDIPLNALLLHGIAKWPTWNGVSWSISIELGLYLSFVAFIAISPQWRLWTAILLIAVGMFSLAAFSPNGMETTTQFGWARGLAGFYCGYLVKRADIPAGGTAAEILAVVLVVAFVSLPKGPWQIAAPFVFSVAVAIFATETGKLSQVLRWRPFEMLGAWSYSIYLSHYLVAVAIAAAVNQLDLHADIRLLFFYLVAAVGFAALAYYAIDLPAQNLAKRRRASVTPALSR